VPTFTLAELEEDVWDGLDSNDSMYPEPNVRYAINQGTRRLSLLTGFCQNIVPVPGNTVASQLVYQVPSGIVVPMRVYYEERELSKTSVRELSSWFRNWTTDSSATMGPPARWAPLGSTGFFIHPLDAIGGSLLEVEGIAPITPLVGQEDTAQIDDEDAEILVKYAQTRVRLKLAGKPFADASMTYQEWMRQIKTKMIWEGMVMPRYWVDKQLQPAEGTGT
jgi:hypothetical protein